MVVNLYTFNFNDMRNKANKIITKPFRKGLFKVSIFISIVGMSDLVIGSLLEKFYFKQASGFDYLTTYSLEKTNADVLIFGSSRAVNIFKPDIFEKETGLSCYNVGRYGQPIFYHYAVLKSVLKRYKPKKIILSFDEGNFSIRQEAYDRLAVLLPYYDRHPEIRSIAELKGPHEKVKLLSNIYPYNSLLLPVITSNYGRGEKRAEHSKGFIPLENKLAGRIRTVDYSKETALDNVKIEYYRRFIEECKNSKVELYLACPPYKVNSIGMDRSLSEGKKIAQEYQITFFDYSRDTSFTNNTELFADFRHLNNRGADIISTDIIEKIKRLPISEQTEKRREELN